MSVQEAIAEQFAKVFYQYHEALAADFDCPGGASSESWEGVPLNERHRLVAAVRLTLLDVGSAIPDPRGDRERYFAKPGEAEWGC